MNSRKLLTVAEPLLASVSLIEDINFLIKILCGISTLLVTIFAIRAYIAHERLAQVQRKIDRQRLARMEAEYLELFKNKRDGNINSKDL